MGIQYLPVDSMQTSVQRFLRSQSRQAMRSELKGGEPLFLVRGDAFESSSGDTDGDKFFVGFIRICVVVQRQNVG